MISPGTLALNRNDFAEITTASQVDLVDLDPKIERDGKGEFRSVLTNVPPYYNQFETSLFYFRKNFKYFNNIKISSKAEINESRETKMI